jgi:hypothetical protein
VASIVACRSCGGTALEPVLSLGKLPLVNVLVAPEDPGPEPRYPLDLVRCTSCTLTQITETVPPALLFTNYPYFSSYSQTFREHAGAFAARALDEMGLGGESLVVEAASNDGYLLRYFAEAGVPTLGIEPARNIARVAEEYGIETIVEFLDERVAHRIVADRGTADLVVANNVLAHVPDLHGFVAALATIAGRRGRIAIEVPYIRDLIDRMEFDTIYHEHLCYFSVTALVRLFDEHGLAVADIEHLPVHGGSIRVTLSGIDGPSPKVDRILAEERAWGMGDTARFKRFARDVDTARRRVTEFVTTAASGGPVTAYGAAAKGVVLANACGLDTELIRYVVDRNPHKQGKLLPGVRIPVEPAERLVSDQPEYCLLFVWNLADEVLRQQEIFRQRGGRFIVPLPQPHILGA